MIDLVQTLLEREEGRSATAYQDDRGYWTIGIGALVDARFPGAGLCDAAIDVQFAHDSASARAEAADVPGFDRCNEVRQAVVISMCFQLGSLADWPKFRAALGADDYDAAADEMLASQWHTQTPARCERAAQMMRSGAFIYQE
jgi:lysozyme